jgi:NADPH-dependent curcumin reductase CurA
MPGNRQVTLAARPVGEPAESDFSLVESEIPAPGEGEVVARTVWLSLDPYQRGRMSEARSYARPVEIGGVMTAQAVGEVVESRSSLYEPGDLVLGPFGWQEYAAASAHVLRRVDPETAPISTAFDVPGMTAPPASFGLFSIGRPLPGDTVVVSSASGAVGQIAGQLARLAGCRVVGIAGSPEKVDDVLTLYACDAGIDYKQEDVGRRSGARPDGVDVYFDNVGGAVSSAVHRNLARGARVVICGQIADYNDVPPHGGPRSLGFMIVRRVQMEGFLVGDFAHLYEPALGRLRRWLADGRLRYREDVVEGLELAPRAFIGLLRGENRGKLLVKVADP